MVIMEEMRLETISSETNSDDTYFYIGIIVITVSVLLSAIMMIRKCIKYYNKEEQIEQSNRLLRSETILQRNSSIRNSLTPYRRSSLDIRFLMECRERRLSQSQLILIPTQII